MCNVITVNKNIAKDTVQQGHSKYLALLNPWLEITTPIVSNQLCLAAT